VTPWVFRVVWPVEDESLGYQEAVRIAAAEIVEVAQERGAKLVAQPTWEMVEHDDPGRWPHTELALVAWAPAMPLHPTRDQWPVVVRWYAAQGWSDRQIGKEFGVPRDTIVYVRRRHGIAAGVPASGKAAA
jgi:hypothetical protein